MVGEVGMLSIPYAIVMKTARATRSDIRLNIVMTLLCVDI